MEWKRRRGIFIQIYSNEDKKNGCQSTSLRNKAFGKGIKIY